MEPAAGHTGGPIMQAMDELSGEDLVDRSGATAQQLRRLVDLGIITPTPQGRYRRSDIQRIRVVDALADAGFAPEQLSDLIAKGAYSLDWASVVFPEPTARLTTTLEQTAVSLDHSSGKCGRQLLRAPPRPISWSWQASKAAATSPPHRRGHCVSPPSASPSSFTPMTRHSTAMITALLWAIQSFSRPSSCADRFPIPK
jgi:DNA-binding transcriptional MerR regulator